MKEKKEIKMLVGERKQLFLIRHHTHLKLAPISDKIQNTLMGNLSLF